MEVVVWREDGELSLAVDTFTATTVTPASQPLKLDGILFLGRDI